MAVTSRLRIATSPPKAMYRSRVATSPPNGPPSLKVATLPPACGSRHEVNVEERPDDFIVLKREGNISVPWSRAGGCSSTIVAGGLSPLPSLAPGLEVLQPHPTEVESRSGQAGPKSASRGSARFGRIPTGRSRSRPMGAVADGSRLARADRKAGLGKLGKFGHIGGDATARPIP